MIQELKNTSMQEYKSKRTHGNKNAIIQEYRDILIYKNTQEYTIIHTNIQENARLYKDTQEYTRIQ